MYTIRLFCFFAIPLKQKSPRIRCKTECTGCQLGVSRLLMSEGSARQIFVLNSRPEHERMWHTVMVHSIIGFNAE